MQTAVHYYSLLNSLQYKRRSSLLEPVIGFVQAQKTFFDMGNETLSRKEFEDFVGNISASVQRQVILMLTSFVLLSFLLFANVFCHLFVVWEREREMCSWAPPELHLTTSELWFGQEQEGILP